MAQIIDRTDPANRPPTRWELGQMYNLEAAMRRHPEDGEPYIDWNLVPTEVPVRIVEETRIFWNQVDPRRCIQCKALMDSCDPEYECMECRWEPWGTEWQREHGSIGEERWVRTHPLG